VTEQKYPLWRRIQAVHDVLDDARVRGVPAPTWEEMDGYIAASIARGLRQSIEICGELEDGA
jgi:hypothetical protein